MIASPPVEHPSWEREVDVDAAIAQIAPGSAVLVIDEEAEHGALVIAPAAMSDAWMEVFLERTTGAIRDRRPDHAGPGAPTVRLLTDHPRRHRGLSGFGLEVVEYVPLTPGASR